MQSRYIEADPAFRGFRDGTKTSHPTNSRCLWCGTNTRRAISGQGTQTHGHSWTQKRLPERKHRTGGCEDCPGHEGRSAGDPGWPSVYNREMQMSRWYHIPGSAACTPAGSLGQCRKPPCSSLQGLALTNKEQDCVCVCVWKKFLVTITEAALWLSTAQRHKDRRG